MKMIVAVDKDWGIGKNQGLLFHLPSDLKFFKEKTLNKTVVMGRNTLLSLPNGQALKNRNNIVIASSPFSRTDCTVVHSLNKLLNLIKNYSDDEVFLIGGARLYNALADYCSEAFVTKIDAFGDADTFIDSLDEKENWSLKTCAEKLTENGVSFCFNVYQNNKIIEV